MSTLSESIDVDVPARFADREWSEFVFRRLVGHHMTTLGEITWGTTGDESDATSGIVRFFTKGDQLTKVTVELEYEPHSWSDFETEEAIVRERLRDDLQRYKAFLLRRCQEESCRDA
jgi:uncharacterized membrane protein